MSELRIKNQSIAVFAAVHLDQNPRIERTLSNSIEYVFTSELTFRQIDLLFRGSAIQKVLELNIAFGKEKKHLLTQK